jgi:very-short-patch-repair endonuclease
MLIKMSTELAHNLRRTATDAEKALWRLLRASQLAGAKFRRQQPIGPYIADFISFSHRVVVECDGGRHCDSPGDEARDAWFASQGFRTFRFWNNEVLGNPEGAPAILIAALVPGNHRTEAPPHPSPLPRGERELRR